MLAWVTNMLTSPDLYIEFSTEWRTKNVVRFREQTNDEEQLLRFLSWAYRGA